MWRSRRRGSANRGAYATSLLSLTWRIGIGISAAHQTANSEK